MRRLLVICILLVLVEGCATNNSASTVTSLNFSESHPTIALMPMDVRLSQLDASGVSEPRSEWTRAAKGFMHDEFSHFVMERGTNMVDGSGIQDEKLVDLLSLHAVVGNTIMIHHYMVPLPTKGKNLDWSLGREASALRDKLHADYGLFIYVRDSYSSGGRVALQILAAAAGVGVQGGTQIGFASLVDLRTGDIVWFNKLFSTTGDLRKEKPARSTFARLMTGFPEF